MRSLRAALAASSLAIGLALAPAPWERSAAAQPRIDYRSPVAGGTLELSVDKVAPFADVSLVLLVDGQPTMLPLKADASGAARVRLPVPLEAAGKTYDFIASEEGSSRPAELSLAIAPPSLLLTGTSGGEAWLFEVPLDPRAESPFRVDSIVRHALGRGRPGAAVRDGDGSTIFAIADADAGRVAVLRAGALPLRLILDRDLRGIAATPDGRSILVAAAGASGASGRLYVIDAERPTER